MTTPEPLRKFHLAVYSDARELGGAEVTLGLLLGGLPDQIRVSIVCVDDSVGRWLCDHRAGMTHQVVAPIERRSQLGRMREHRTVLRRLGADIIQFNLSMASSCQWAIAVALTVRGVKVVAVENSSMGAWSSTSALLKRTTARRLSAHLAVGEATARSLEKQSGLAPGSIETMYHGVADVPTEVPRDGAGPVICNVARHDPVKGVDVLLDAMPFVDPGIRLVQIGGGPLRGDLIAQRDRLGLTHRVEFRELPWDVRVADLLAGFDLFVLTSRIEGLPVSVMEAMLAGLPVVVTDVGSIREEVIDNENGLIVPAEDPSALARAINELMGDPERRAAMGRRSREIAAGRFTIEATVDRYLDVYRRVLGGVRR